MICHGDFSGGERCVAVVEATIIGLDEVAAGLADDLPRYAPRSPSATTTAPANVGVFRARSERALSGRTARLMRPSGVRPFG